MDGKLYRLKQYKILKVILLLQRKMMDGKRKSFEVWKRNMVDDHFEFKQRANELQSIKLRYIEDFI